jgi:hypothetical protein
MLMCALLLVAVCSAGLRVLSRSENSCLSRLTLVSMLIVRLSLTQTPLPGADLNMDIAQYSRVICALLDIPGALRCDFLFSAWFLAHCLADWTTRALLTGLPVVSANLLRSVTAASPSSL